MEHRTRSRTAVLAGCLAAALAAGALAQGGPGAPPVRPGGARTEQRAGAGGPGSQQARMYDVATVETITGTIAEVQHQTPRNGAGRGRMSAAGGRGVHLIVSTDGGDIPVHLGPQWFVDRQDLRLDAGDRVTITGSRVTLDEQDVLIAATVQRGRDVLALRDEDGFPRWSASGRLGAGMGPMRGGWRAAARCWDPGSEYGRIFDPGTLATVTGEVEDVGYHTPRFAAGLGVHLTLRAAGADEPLTVHLGPAWYVERQDLALEPGDSVTVTGSRVESDTGPMLIASEVETDRGALELRDANGFPRWSASRAGRGWGAGRAIGQPDGAAIGYGPRGPRRSIPGRADWPRIVDAGAALTISGEVTDVRTQLSRTGGWRGVHLEVTTDDGTESVHLGPAWYLENQDTEIQVGDRVTITGWRGASDGTSAVIAGSVETDGGVLELRDQAGIPRWAAWRSGSTPR